VSLTTRAPAADRLEDPVPAAIAVLTEEALGDDDARRILALHADDNPRYHVIVPSDTDRSLLADVLDHLSLLELKEALEAARGHDDVTPAEAAAALEQSLAALRSYGAEAEGEVVEGDPVAALMRVTGGEAGVWEAVVVTRPHAVEDTFHRDWASKARELLGVPVLHVYAGSSFLG
jgi:hypothetical protein